MKTEDMGLAAALIASGLKMKGLDVDADGNGEFEFEDQEDINTLVWSFSDGTMMVSAKRILWEMRILKSLCKNRRTRK